MEDIFLSYAPASVNIVDSGVRDIRIFLSGEIDIRGQLQFLEFFHSLANWFLGSFEESFGSLGLDINDGFSAF